MYRNVINVFTVTFDTSNVSSLNKSINIGRVNVCFQDCTGSQHFSFDNRTDYLCVLLSPKYVLLCLVQLFSGVIRVNWKQLMPQSINPKSAQTQAGRKGHPLILYAKQRDRHCAEHVLLCFKEENNSLLYSNMPFSNF